MMNEGAKKPNNRKKVRRTEIARCAMSSLAAQLAQTASQSAALLVGRSRQKSAESYLFTGREADQHDLESIMH